MPEKAKAPAIRFKGFTDDWEQRKLGNIAEVTSGLTGDALLPNGKYRLTRIETISDGAIDENKVGYTNMKPDINYLLRCGDILFSNINSLSHIGKVAIFQGVSALYHGINLLRIMVNRSISTPDFIFHQFNTETKRNWAKVHANQAVSQASINQTLLAQQVFHICHRSEQAKISEFLSHLENLITLHHRKFLKLKNVKKAMLEKMLPKNGSNVPEIRFAGFTDAWEQRKLGEIAKEVNRNDPNSTAPIMMITANNGFINQSDRYSFNNSGDSLKKYILLKQNELAYNHGASKIRPFGSCFTLPCEEARIPFVYHCFSVGNNDPEFISTELNGSSVESQLRKIISSGARMDGLLNISFEEYCSVSLMLPDLQEQIILSHFFKNLDNLITLHQRKLKKLKNIKKACLEKMFV